MRTFLRGHWFEGDTFNRLDTLVNLFWACTHHLLRALCWAGLIPTRSASRFPWLHQWSENEFSTAPAAELGFTHTTVPVFDGRFSFLGWGGEQWMDLMGSSAPTLTLSKLLAGPCCTHPLLVSRCATGYGVRALEPIPGARPIALYLGEYFKGAPPHASKKFDQSFEHSIWITAATTGNVTRFMDHKCYENNAAFVPYALKSPLHPRSKGLPYGYIKTTRAVRAMQSVTYPYWPSDYIGNPGIPCACGHPDCWGPHFPVV